MGENICKSYDKGLISSIYKELWLINKNQRAWLKNEQRIWIDISPNWHPNGQQTYEKMIIITNHLRNANQNHNVISAHTC